MARKCTTWIDSYLEFTEDFEPPKIYNKWSGLLVLSAVTGRKLWIQDANMRIYPNLYVALIGPSGVGKTSAMRETMPFLSKRIKFSADKPTDASLIKDIADHPVIDVEYGILTPYLLWGEELPSFLGPDAYKSGLLADLTALYDCPTTWEKQTKHVGIDTIAAPYICLFGGATPTGLFDVLPPGTIAQGFTSRLMFIFARYNAKRVVEKPWHEKHIKLQAALLEDIDKIAALRGELTFSETARALWADYYLHRPMPDVEFPDPRLQGYASRKPFYAKKLSMLFSIAESDNKVIEAQHLERALDTMEEADRNILDVYSEMSPSPILQAYPKIVRALKSANEPMLWGELHKKLSYFLDKNEFRLAAEGLRDMGVVDYEYIPVNIGGTRVKTYVKLTREGETKRW